MKNIILKNGLLGGLAVGTIMIAMTAYMKYNPQYEPSSILGFSSILLANLFVVLGILEQRKANSGSITFGKAFQIGILISLITSIIYVALWLIMYYNFFPDFMDRYADLVLKHTNPEELAQKTADINQMKEWYKSPLMIILLTLMEVFPFGIAFTLVASLIIAFLLKRKENH
jgi:F0F1-type ATP synthase assembly protein I